MNFIFAYMKIKNYSAKYKVPQLLFLKYNSLYYV